MSRYSLQLIVLTCALCAVAGCTQGTSNSAAAKNAGSDEGSSSTAANISTASGGSTDDDTWVHNGATACDKYLTPDLVGQIFKNPAGQNKKSDSQSCTFETAHQPDTDFSTINIYLRDGGADIFDMDIETKNGTPINGIGDKAVRTQEDGVQAVKGDHICSIYVKAPFGNRLKGEAMAQKLGEVCNKLFALP